MSDEKDPDEGSDWLSSQFDATGLVPTPPPPVAPPVAPPASSSGGGFNWGLTPAGEAPPAAVQPPAAQSVPAPPPLISPPTKPFGSPPTPPYAGEPTVPFSWDHVAPTQQLSTSAPVPQQPVEQPTEAYAVQPWQPGAAASPVAPAGMSTDPAAPEGLPASPVAPTSAIDSLFGDHKFHEYEEVGVLDTVQALPAGALVAGSDQRSGHQPLGKTQKVLLIVAGGLLAALILLGMFFLGQHLGSAAAVVPTGARTGASSATPTPAGTGGPAAPGLQQWSALQGGECIQSFSSGWALTFSVVACTADHSAEMVFKGRLPDDAHSKYPTAAGFQKELTPLCSAPTAINYATAAGVTDLQVSFSYPPDTASWLSGHRTYYCFVNRVSGGNLPGNLAVTKVP